MFEIEAVYTTKWRFIRLINVSEKLEIIVCEKESLRAVLLHP